MSFFLLPEIQGPKKRRSEKTRSMGKNRGRFLNRDRKKALCEGRAVDHTLQEGGEGKLRLKLMKSTNFKEQGIPGSRLSNT